MADNKTPDQEFDDAWNESTAEPSAAAEDTGAPDAESTEDAGAPALAIVVAPADEQAATANEEAGEAETPAEQKSEGPAGEAAEAHAEEQAETPEEAQKRKSWEGRLKVREAELASREAELKSKEAALPAPATGDIAAIVAKLNDQFGEDFVSDLLAIMDAKCGDAYGKAHGEVMGLQQSIQSALYAMHQSAILDAHPDLDDVLKSDGFKFWLEGQPEDKKESAQAVMERGMWPQIIRLIATYKAETAKPAEGEAAPVEEPVSPTAQTEDPWSEMPPATPASAPVRVADTKAAADDFDAAWYDATR